MTWSTLGGRQRGFTVLALTLLLACIWSTTHVFHEFSADATLYAMQAMAKLHPWLGTDIYLQNTSQDTYSVFSWFYAKLIAVMGVHAAARTMYVAFCAWFLAASWFLARRLSGERTAWFAVLLLTIIVGRYGSFGVFHYAEDYLTARQLAEALIATSLACFYGGARRTAMAIAAAAILVHPLMALPGLLLLICLWSGARISIAGALAGICLAGLIAVAARHPGTAPWSFTLIDGDWLQVVRERSQFLFLPLWNASDWLWNALPFASLLLTWVFVPDERVRRLVWAAMLVGITGLAIAFIAGVMPPVAILLQGQAWRWVWITSFASILLLAPTLRSLWRIPSCGPLCALLLICGWTCDFLNIWFCMALVLLLWIIRAHINERSARLLRWTALLLAVIVIGWTIALTWTNTHVAGEVTGESSAVTTLRHVVRLPTAALVLFGIAFWWLSARRAAIGPAIACLIFVIITAWTLSGALRQARTTGTEAEISAFADWRNAMPRGSNVAMLGEHYSAAFIWFTLDRTDYLSIDQSAGVVFSRATALEVERRSTVLEPVVQPSWKIMTYLAKRAGGQRGEDKDQPLTGSALSRMCLDPQLNFVIAEQYVGFDALRHTAPGPYKNWYLYDCGRVRASRPA